MTNHSLKCILLFILFKFNHTCFNHLNYLFLNDISLINIPLLPRNCVDCQKAYQVDIQLIDESYSVNRTIQRIKINLKNFEIEDSSYICLIADCPIIVEYGNDKIQLNITSKVFSHVFLLLNYFLNTNQTIVCSIQTRFAIFLLNKSFTCTNEVYVHPRFHMEIIGQMKFYDCQAYLFEKIIYDKSIKFQQINFQSDRETFRMKSTENSCEYMLEYVNYVNSNSSVQINEFLTKITIFPYFDPWNKNIQILGPCRTKIIPYKEMVFTEDVVNIRNIFIEKGQTIEIECPIDGSKKYLKYLWYYQRYQPKYQISNNRTIVLRNITEHMQGKYMCIGDDQYETLEFEMTLHLLNHNKTNNNSFYWIVMLILLLIIILFCSILTFVLYISLKKFSRQISNSKNCLIEKPNALTIHHDVMLTIQHLSEQQQQQPKNYLWNQPPYQTLDYIDEQSIYPLPSNQLIQQIPYQYSTRHRNLNRQLSINSPLIQSHSDLPYSPIVKFNKISNEKSHDIEILKISVPFLTKYPLIKSSSSVISFDSQYELDQFNQMTSLCMDNE